MEDSHNRVETEREIPKLNCVACQMGRLTCATITETDTTCARIQYGTEPVQTTTNKERGVTICYELHCLLVGSRLYV